MSKIFDKACHTSLLHKPKSYEISGRIFGLIYSFLRNRRLPVVVDGKFHEKMQLMLEFLKASILILHFFYYTLMTFLMTLCVILLSMLMILPSTSCIGSVATTRIDFWIWSTRHCWVGQEATYWFQYWKTQLVSFERSNNTGGWKRVGLFLWENHFLRCWYWGSYSISIAKTVSKKIGALTRSMKFLSPEVALYFYKSTIRHVWNTVVMSRLALLVATWNCWISYKNGYARLLILHLLPLWNPWLIDEVWPA